MNRWLGLEKSLVDVTRFQEKLPNIQEESLHNIVQIHRSMTMVCETDNILHIEHCYEYEYCCVEYTLD